MLGARGSSHVDTPRLAKSPQLPLWSTCASYVQRAVPRSGIERDDAAEWRREIERAVHHERRRFELDGLAGRDVGVAGSIGPGDGELRDVVARDLRERRESASALVVAVGGPLSGGGLAGGYACERKKETRVCGTFGCERTTVILRKRERSARDRRIAFPRGSFNSLGATAIPRSLRSSG